MYSCENECFTDLIGLRDVCEPPVIKSCYYIDDLGVNRRLVESIITSNYPDVSDFFQKQLNLAANQMASEVHANFQNKYLITSLIESQRLGFLQDNKSVKATNSKWAGIYVELKNTSSFIDFYSSEIILTTDFTGNIPIRIYDVYTGTILATVTLVSVAGTQSALPINEIFKSKRKSAKLFICYDTTGINSYKTLIKDAGCSTCSGYNYSNSYLISRGAYSEANTFLLTDITGADHTFGMSIQYSLNCNHKDWICAHSNILSLGLAYKLCSNICLYGLQASPHDRVNTAVTINREKLETDQGFYEDKYLYEMQSKLKFMNVPSDKKCFYCSQPYKTVLVLP